MTPRLVAGRDFSLRADLKKEVDLHLDSPAPYDESELGDGAVETTAKDYVDARLDAERARTETQFAHVEARFSQIDAKFAEVLSGIELLKATSITRPQLWGAAGTIIAAVLGVMLAALSFAGDRFDGGIAASGMIREVQEAQEARDAAQDEKLGQILEAIQSLRPTASE